MRGEIVFGLLLFASGTAAAAGETFRGRFYWGHEVRSFQPCGSSKSYWVKAREQTLKPLRERSERLRKERGDPYPVIYMEAAGTIDTKSRRDGFASDYDGLFRVSKVIRVSNAVPKECAK